MNSDVFNPVVSTFGPITERERTPLATVRILEVAESIKSGKYKSLIEQIRAQPPGSTAQRKLKLKLPSFTPSGEFVKGRSIAGSEPAEYSGLGQIDIDGKTNTDRLINSEATEEWRNRLGRDAHVFIANVSPGGLGIKLLVRISLGVASYKELMSGARAYVQEKYGLIADRIDDVQHMCFVSHDPDLIVNESAIPLPHTAALPDQRAEPDAVDGLDYLQPARDDISASKAREILSFLSPDLPYPDWFKVACGLKHQFQNTPEEAFRLFDEWSAGSAQKYEGANKTRAFWNRLQANPDDREPATFASIVYMAEQRGYRTAASPPPIVHVKEILENPPERPSELIHGVLFQGRKLIMAAPSKARKTWTNLDLAVSVALGHLWLGYETTQSTVLYLDFELGDFEFFQRLSSLLEAKRVSHDLPLFHWALRGWTLDLRILLPEIRRFISENAVGLIVVDPLYAALMGRDENSNSEMTQLMLELEHLAQNSRAAIAIVHHYAKGNPSGKEAQDRMSGAGALARAADAMLLLTPHADDTDEQPLMVVEFITRSFAKPPKAVLRWEYPLWVPDESRDPSDLKRQGGRSPVFGTDNLLELFTGKKLRYNQLLEKAKARQISESTFKRLLKRALHDGDVFKQGVFYYTLL